MEGTLNAHGTWYRAYAKSKMEYEGFRKNVIAAINGSSSCHLFPLSKCLCQSVPRMR